MSCLPDFLVIGAARSGSTWIHECLKEHPLIGVPRERKELHFFNKDENFSKGLCWYRAFFDDLHGFELKGEVTPTYLCDEKSAARIKDVVPEVRLVASLRNPTERAFSAYMGHIMNGNLSRSDNIFEADSILKFDNQSGLLAHGHYSIHLKRFLYHFDRARILVVFFDELQANPRRFIDRIVSFLGVETGFELSVLNRRVNEGRFSPMLRAANLLSKKLPEPVAAVVQKRVIRLRKRYAPLQRKMTARERIGLDRYYKPYNDELRRQLGQQLPPGWS